MPHHPLHAMIISQIRNARELVHLRRICERQNLKAQSAADAKQLDFGVKNHKFATQGSLFTCALKKKGMRSI